MHLSQVPYVCLWSVSDDIGSQDSAQEKVLTRSVKQAVHRDWRRSHLSKQDVSSSHRFLCETDIPDTKTYLRSSAWTDNQTWYGDEMLAVQYAVVPSRDIANPPTVRLATSLLGFNQFLIAYD